MDELHLVRLGLRLRRRALPARGVRADCRRAHPGGGRAGDVRNARARTSRRHRLRRDAAGHGRAVAAGGGLGSRPPASPRGATRSASRSFSWRGSACSGCRTSWVPGFITLAALELAVPVWAERAAPTTWHPQHIAERYGLLTLIVLGESILAATVADPVGARLGRSAPRPPAAHRRRAADRVLDVVDVLRSSGARSADQSRQGDRLGLRTLPRLCRRGGSRCGPGRQRRSGHPSREGQRGRRRCRRGDPGRGLSWCASGFSTTGRSTARLDGSARLPRCLVLLTPFTGYAVPLIGVILASLVAVKLVLQAPVRLIRRLTEVSMMISKVVRRTHMFLALFLFPWVLMYALEHARHESSRALRRQHTARARYRSSRNDRLVYDGVFPENAELRTISKQILMSVGLDGAHGVSRRQDGTIAINRNDLVSPRRLTYSPADRTLAHRTDAASSERVSGTVPPAARLRHGVPDSIRSGRSRSTSSSSRWCSGCCRGSGCGGK